MTVGLPSGCVALPNSTSDLAMGLGCCPNEAWFCGGKMYCAMSFEKTRLSSPPSGCVANFQPLPVALVRQRSLVRSSEG